MKYENVVKANFISRPNRFVADVMINGKQERVHVKNTGRCRELLLPGAEIILEDFKGRMGTRKLRYSIISVYKDDLLINMDSQAPNKACEEAIRDGRIFLPDMGTISLLEREKTYGSSRFDFYIEGENENKGWLEVKGVTLEENGIVKFPDAPTERGIKHIRELDRAVKEGYKGYILFLVQMEKAKWFSPNDITHKAFGDELRIAEKNGVRVLCYDCVVTENSMDVKSPVKVKL